MRRIVESPGYTEIEMDVVPALDLPSIEDIHTNHFSANNEILLSGFEAAPTSKVDGFKDEIRIFADQLKAEFSPEETAVSTLGLLPSALKELGHQMPGVGALLTTGFLAEDIHHWKHLQKHIEHTRGLLQSTSVISDDMLKNTLSYVMAQLERRSNKLLDSMGGKTLQATGSILIFTGLFTHGVTAIPGLALGIAGTVIKSRISIRSAFNNLRKRVNKELSINRENHARYLYGLTLLHLHRIGAHNGDYSHSKEAKRSIDFVQNIPGDNHDAAQIAAEFVCSLKGLEFFKTHALTTAEMDHFLEYGLWKIMLGIKS